jgi:hypothetical protein
MQKRTIAKNIKNKLEDWLKSITDEKLREDTRKNVVVSGGSICSLFLNQPVNDYDVYLKSEDVAYRLAKYYTKAFNLEVMSYTNHNSKDKYREGIKGLTVRNLQPGQVKIFLAHEAPSGYRTQFENEGLGKYLPLFFSPNAISLSDNLQIVLRFTGTVEEIHKSFDFIHATNYYTFDEGLVTNIKALESILTHQLSYQGSLYPLTTIIRMKKFLKRGWNVNAGEMLKCMFQISRLDLTKPEVLEENLVGVDVAYFSTLVEILRNKYEKEPLFELSFDYLCTLIDRVFSEEDNETLQPEENE